MQRGKVKDDSKEESASDLLPGMIFSKKDSVYIYQMILSDRQIKLSDGNIIRECVAWNDDMCRRYDVSENELSKSDYLGIMNSDDLYKYIVSNKKDEWSDPKIPKDICIGI